jgi:hypothetical protein
MAVVEAPLPQDCEDGLLVADCAAVQVGAVQVAQYAVLSHLPLEVLPSGVQVNSLRVPPPATFRILYHTNFNEAYITYRYRGDLVRGSLLDVTSRHLTGG